MERPSAPVKLVPTKLPNILVTECVLHTISQSAATITTDTDADSSSSFLAFCRMLCTVLDFGASPSRARQHELNVV